MCQYHEDNPTVKQTEIGGTRQIISAKFANHTDVSSNVWRRTKVFCHEPLIVCLLMSV